MQSSPVASPRAANQINIHVRFADADAKDSQLFQLRFQCPAELLVSLAIIALDQLGEEGVDRDLFNLATRPAMRYHLVPRRAAPFRPAEEVERRIRLTRILQPVTRLPDLLQFILRHSETSTAMPQWLRRRDRH